MDFSIHLSSIAVGVISAAFVAISMFKAFRRR